MTWAVSMGCTNGPDREELPGFRRAVVSDGTVATPYWVAGAGLPVVVLGDDACLSDGLLRELASRFRLILPDVTASGDGRAFSVWLRGFLDGLGLCAVSVVVGPAHALALLGFTLVEHPRVTRLALLVQDAVDPVAPASAIHEELAGVDLPLLVVRLDAAGPPPAEIASDVMKFLTGGAE